MDNQYNNDNPNAKVNVNGGLLNTNPTPSPIPPTPPVNPKIKIISVIAGMVILAGIGYLFFTKQPGRKLTDKASDLGNKIKQTPPALASKFATYEEVPVNVTPKVPTYSVNKDLSNIVNTWDFKASDAAKNLLVSNGFVVVPGTEREFFPMYEKNRYEYIPSFVTTDSILHNYHLMFDYLLKKLEEEKLAAELKNLNASMLNASLEQYNTAKGTEWENAAKRNVGFFAVASKLLDQNVQIPPLVSNEVNQELNLISAHQGISESPVMNIGENSSPKLNTPQGALGLEELKEDYSQYIPRGHYDKTEMLKAYFKTMMWYGRLTFRFKNDDEIKSAALISQALGQGENFNSWNKIYEPTNFFVGKSDDITYYQMKELLDKLYGANVDTTILIKDKTKFATLVTSAQQLDAPRINSIPIFQESIQPDREKEIKGFRFMGQRFTIDASIFQRLIYRDVKENAQGETRMLPKGLDIPAAMGSNEALNILQSQGDTGYKNYPENLNKLKNYIAGLNTDMWTQNLYWGWMYALKPMTEEKPAGYPFFMRNTAWMRKELNTYLGSWTELKHDTILYAKQVYAELGGGGGDDTVPPDDRGYVEPNPYVYARLASLLNMTREGLEIRGLLSDANKDNLKKMEQLVLSLKAISEKELNNVALTDEEYELIRSYGGQLEHFWLEVNKEDMTSGTRDHLDKNPAAIVADVATDPNGYVLEEATGHISTIYAVVPVAGKLKIAKGGVFSYYEFPWDISDRLTDTKWREMLDAGQAPALPVWTQAFIAK